MVSIIAALAEGNRAIGWRGGMPWRLPADLAHFRKLTMGHAVIMGRVTWEPIAARGLPGRRVIVLTRGDPSALPGAGGGDRGRSDQATDGRSPPSATVGRSPPSATDPEPDATAAVARSLPAALELAERAGSPAGAEPDPEIFIAGGASVYEQALEAELVDRMYLTLVQAEVRGDAFFPEFDRSQWSLIASESRPADAENRHAMRFETYQRQRDR